MKSKQSKMQSRRDGEIVVLAETNAVLRDRARDRFMQHHVILIPGDVPTLLPARLRRTALQAGMEELPDATEGVEPKVVDQGRSAGKRVVIAHLGRPHQTTQSELETRFVGEAQAGRLSSVAVGRAVGQLVFHGVPEDAAISELNGLEDNTSGLALTNAMKRLLATHVPETAARVFEINVAGVTGANTPPPDDAQGATVDDLLEQSDTRVEVE